MNLSELQGYELGQRTVRYQERDAILYALAVGAASTEIDLVYERDLQVLPTYACALGLWAVEAAGELGAYDRKYSPHASQSLVVHQPMPKSGAIETTGRITGVCGTRARPRCLTLRSSPNASLRRMGFSSPDLAAGEASAAAGPHRWMRKPAIRGPGTTPRLRTKPRFIG